MELQQIKQLKAELEEKIKKDIIAFEEQTECKVGAVELSTVNIDRSDMSYPSKVYLANIKVKIEL